MFKKAIPVFAKGKENEMNLAIALRANVSSLIGATLNIAASSFFRLTVNGEFVFFGPSRAPVGHARVESIELGEYSREGNNEIIIEVVGYRCASLATVNRSSFVCAELLQGGNVVLATGRDFCGYLLSSKIQKTERYSVQRHFEEVYDFTLGDVFADQNRVELSPVADIPTYLSSTPHPCFDRVDISAYGSRGVFADGGKDPEKLNRYSWTPERCQRLKDEWGFFDTDEIKHLPYRKMMRQIMTKTAGGGTLPVTLKAGEYAVLDLGKIYAGFLRIGVKTQEKSNVYLAYSELCTVDKFEFSNMNCQNVIEYALPEGFCREIMSFEPYTCRYAAIMVNEGEITLDSFGITKYEFDRRAMVKREFKDAELERIYHAGERSFSHNSVDIYMDCPSRERAGWLCDSLFTSRAEYFLTGKTAIEDAFLENYRLFKPQTSLIPDGMIPECYPSDIEDIFIPQWAMWYMLEVYEYLTERNTEADKSLFYDSLYGLVKFFAKYENADGLLENLPSWNFVEWSKANEWVQDVNYPTSFLYAESLDRVGKLYGDKALCDKAEKIRRTTIEKSFNGKVFIDNAVKDENGVLKNTENFSECGQYYAILFGGIDINSDKFAYLKRQVFEGFAEMKENSETFTYVDIMPGFYLKMWALMRLGFKEHLSHMIKDFFSEMIDLTDTLWEYRPSRRKGSYDHGFASYAVVAADYCDK